MRLSTATKWRQWLTSCTKMWWSSSRENGSSLTASTRLSMPQVRVTGSQNDVLAEAPRSSCLYVTNTRFRTASRRQTELERIRRLVVPDVVFRLHRALFETSSLIPT